MIYNICSKDIYNIYTIKSIGVKCVATPQSLKIWYRYAIIRHKIYMGYTWLYLLSPSKPIG